MPQDSGENKGVELQRAARNGNARLVKELIGKGAQPHSQDEQGWCDFPILKTPMQDSVLARELSLTTWCAGVHCTPQLQMGRLRCCRT